MPNRNGPKMSTSSKSNTFYLRFWQVSLLLIVLVAWHWASQDRNFAFFFGQPVEVAKVIWVWFVTNADIYQHLGVTLTETVLAFIIGTLGGLGFGLWLGLSRGASALLDPYITAANSIDRKSTRLNSSH